MKENINLIFITIKLGHKVNVFFGFITIVIVLLIFNFTLLIKNSHSQWIQQTINTTSPLNSIKFINRYTGWVCGGDLFTLGIIFKTTNGGENWIEQTYPAANKDLFDIHPIDSNIVYCVGKDKTLLKTTNGGANWIALQNGSSTFDPDYIATYFLSENTGWICGTGEYVFKTTNGGNSFDSSYVFWGHLNDIYFKDTLNGIMVGNFAGVFKTTNGGNNWYQINLNIPGGQPDLKRVTFINDFTGWISFGEKGIFKTTDFGTTWDSISYIPSIVKTYGINFSSANTGWVSCRLLENSYWVTYLYKSINGGLEWIRENLPSQITYDIYSYNDSIVWIAANSGKLWHTITGGQVSVKQISSEIPLRFELHQNYPNPFNNQTTIKFEIIKQGIYKLEIFDCLGREIIELLNEYLNTGIYILKFNAEKLSSGVFIYKLSTPDFTQIKKMILIK